MQQIPVKLILTDDLNGTHCELRPEYKARLIGTNAESRNDDNGRMVVPHEISDTISILINTEKIKQYTEDGSLTWIGTVSHELTHAIDYYQMARRESLAYYDSLEDSSLFGMFQMWSEYHARKLGYSFLREYHSRTEGVIDEKQQINHIMVYEWPVHKKNHFQDYHSGIDAFQQIYITMQLLGRYSVWCDLFPDEFNEQILSSEFYHTPWMGNLFSFLRKHESFEAIYPVFDGLRQVLAENWSFLSEKYE